MKRLLVIFLTGWALFISCKSNKSVLRSSIGDGEKINPGMQIVRKLYNNGNIAISPLSISSAMSMVYLGSNGQTRDEIKRVFHFSGEWPEHHEKMGDMLSNIRTDTNNTTVSIANGIWVDRSYQVKRSYILDLENYYRANLSEVSFRSETERKSANQQVNAWIERETNGKIENLIPENAFTPLTRLVLVNAIYFKSDWMYPFAASSNTTENFLTSGGQQLTTTFMNQRNNFRLLKQPHFSCLEMPYQHGQFSMLFFLPDRRARIDSFFNTFQMEVIDSLMDEAPTYVDLKMPKFTIDHKTSLNQTLKELGMKKAFTNDAEFLNITDKNELKITDVFHGVYIEVNEKGTEAAGSTGVIMGLKSAVMDVPEKFYLNRSFMFMIYDKKVNEVLFTGIFVKPKNE